MVAKTAQELLQEAYLGMRGILSPEDNQIVEDILALDELSKKTLGNYVDSAKASYDLEKDVDKQYPDTKKYGKTTQRIKGIVRATRKLNKEQKELIGNILEELEKEYLEK